MHESLRGVLSALPGAALAADHEGNIVFANDPVTALLGYDVVDIVGRPLATLVPERFRARHHTGFDRYWETGTFTLPAGRFQGPALTASGEDIEVVVLIRRFMGPEDAPVVVGVFQAASEGEPDPDVVLLESAMEQTGDGDD